MAEKILLDTSMLIDILDKGRDMQLLKGDCYLSIISIYEYIRYKHNAEEQKLLLEGAFEVVSFSNPIGLDYNDPAAKDDIVLANEIHLPLGKTALIHLMSMDVVHDFAVPEFRIKQDVVPGMDIPLWVKPTRLGTYDLACAQLCGFGHSLMVGHVIVQSPEDFATWLKKNTPVSVAASSANNF